MISFCLNSPNNALRGWTSNSSTTSSGYFNFENIFNDKFPSNKQKYNVKFAEVCRVVLVPKREEYQAAGIKLWWTAAEFNQFKRERYLELTEEQSKKTTETGVDKQTFDSAPSTLSISLMKSPPMKCFILNLNVLVCTSQSAMKSTLLTHFSQYIWSEHNPDRAGTSVCVTYTSHEKALSSLNGGTDPHAIRLSDYNIIIIDNSSSRSPILPTTIPPAPPAVGGVGSGVGGGVSAPAVPIPSPITTPVSAPSPSTARVTCEIVRNISQVAVIICIMENEATIQSNDDCSVEQADLLLPHPQIPTIDHWKELINLLIHRKESCDFLPSPLVQQFITAI